MMEKADEILIGLELLMMGAKVTTGYIGIETNKMPAIELLTKKCAEKFNGSKYNVEVVPLKQRYPQGGEKQLVDAVIQRQVPAPPAIPVNVGAIVQNVGTAYAVYEAVMKHKPLFERYTTVTGKKIKNPGNFLVRMGTPMKDLIEACGGMPDGDNKLLAGGPMMGKALTSVEVPICKGTNSVTVISDDEARRKEPQPCIRCAKCVICLQKSLGYRIGSEQNRRISSVVSSVGHASSLVQLIVRCSIISVRERALSWESSAAVLLKNKKV